jgi:hypothetical protein
MPAWLIIVGSGIGAFVLLGGVIILAVLPELKPRRKKSWLAPPSGNQDGPSIPGEGSGGI